MSNTAIPDYKQAGIIFSQAPRIIKFGFLCVNRESLPKWFGILCFFIFKLETLGLLAKAAGNYLKNDSPSIQAVIKVYVNIFTWTEWLSTGSNGPTIAICILIFAYLQMICAIAVYLNLKLFFRKMIPLYMQAIWALICYFHPLVFFLPIHTFCLEAIKRANDDEFTHGLPIAFQIIFYVILVINFLLAFVFIKVFHVIIKNKDPLACKNNMLKFKDIFIKTLIPVLALFADDAQGLQIFMMFVVVFDAVTRDLILFYYLPYYRIQVLEMLSVIQGSLTPLAIIILLTKLLEDTTLNLGLNFATLTWFLVSPIGIKLYYVFLWKILQRILTSAPSELSVYHILHKRLVLRHFMKYRKLPNADARKVNWFHYLVQAKFSCLMHKMNVEMEELDVPFLNKMSKNFSVEITKNHSKSLLAKACLAQFYVKKESAYLLANNIIEEVLSGNPSFEVRLSLCLIRFDLQKKLYLEYSDQGQDENTGGRPGLNILQFVRTQKRFEQMRIKMKKQVKTQLEFWQNYLASKPDMGELVESALKVNDLKNKVKLDWKELLKLKNPYYIYPYLAYGMYISLANNDAIEGEKFTEFYSKETSKKSKILQIDEMNNKTLFCDNTVQISMSGSRTKLGRILNCSSNVSQAYGWKRDFLIDRPVNLLMSAYFRHKHDRMLLNHFNTGHTRLLNNTVKLAVQTSEGYLSVSWVHIKMNPMVEQGISYISVIRPLSYAPRSIQVRRDGTIDGITKNLAEELNIAAGHSDLHTMKIFTICPEFRAVNRAFNAIIAKMLKDSSGGDSQTLVESEKSEETPDSPKHDGIGETRRKFSDMSSSPNGCSFAQFPDGESKNQCIFDSFTTEGATLVFYPQKNFAVEGNKIKIFASDNNNTNDVQSISYHVQISTRVYEKDLLKVLMLQRIDKPPDILDRACKDRKIGQTQTITYIPEKDEEQFESKGDLPPPPMLPDSMSNRQAVESHLPFMSPKESGQHPLLMSNRPPLTSDSRLLMISPKDNVGLLSPYNPNEDRPLSTEMSNNNSISNIPDEIDEDQHDNRQILRQEFTSRAYQEPENEDNLMAKTSVLTFGKNSASNKKFVGIVAQVRNIYDKTSFFSTAAAHQKSSNEEKTMEPRQEENLLRTKLRRLKEKLNQGIADANKEGSVASSYLSKGKKAQTLVAEALTIVVHRKSTLVFNAAFFGFIFVILLLQVLQAVNIFHAISDIKGKTTVVGNGAYKLNSLMMVNLYARICDGFRKGLYSISNNRTSDEESIRAEIELYKDQLYKYNNLLINEVSTLSYQFQDVFYDKNVRIYYKADDRDQKTLIGTETNFGVTTSVIDHCIRLIASSYQISITMQKDSDLEFILINTLDDLLVSSEKSMTALIDDLQSTLDDVHNRTLATYLVIIATLVCFLGVTVRFVFQMRAHAVRFASLFFRLENHEAEEIKSLLQHFLNSLDNVKTIEIPDEEHEVRQEKAKSSHGTRTFFRQPNMGKFYKAQILVVSRLFPFYLVVVGWTLGYYLNTNSIMNKIVEQEDQIQISLDTLYQQNLILTEFTGLLLTNNSMTVRNKPVETDFLYNIEHLPSAAAMVNAFRSSDGSLTAAEQEAFYDFPCESFRKYNIDNLDWVLNSCQEMSAGTNSVSLIESLSLLYSTTTSYYQRYQEGSKSVGEIIEINKDFIGILSILGGVSPSMCTVLYQISLEDFSSQTKSANTSAIAFTTLTVAALIIGTICVWCLVMKRIFDFESSDKQMLKLVPVKIILSNRYLKQYLIQNSHGKLERMKHFLQ